jgi:uncharacterized protein (DUF2252 family)
MPLATALATLSGMTATVKPKRAAARTSAPTAKLWAAQGAGRPTPKERAALGKELRAALPLAEHAEVFRDPTRPGPIELLEEQAADRVPELIPVRYGRMVVSPFTFYRGAARVMASDLAALPHSALTVQLCGDAHLSNFGFFGSPERRLVFDINDFDETLPGPFEWDVKRLAASLVVAGRENNFNRKKTHAIALAAAQRYREAMAEFAKMREIDVWYASADTEALQDRLRPLLDAKRRKRLGKEFDRYRTRDSMQALAKLAEQTDDGLRITGGPPLIIPLRDLMPAAQVDELRDKFHVLIGQYRRSLQSERRYLLERFHFVDMARKVVGVGSVGTRCWIVLLTGRDDEDPLFLQIKEATASVLSEFLGKSEYANQGQRVVSGQRLIQQASDIFLGWQRTQGIDGVDRDFYVRQLRDWKGSMPIESLLPKGMNLYGQVCAWALAKAHARSGDRVAIAGYLGSSSAFEQAIADFSEEYADLNEGDHRALVDAVATGEVAAQTGL